MHDIRCDIIRARLTEALDPVAMELQDDGHLHVGHAGAKEGGHYTLRIVSAKFTDMRTLARHQLVYRSLGDLMNTDIHALSISALTPEEAE